MGESHGRLARWRKWRSSDVGESKEGLENEPCLRWSNGWVGEWAVTWVKRRKGWRMNCDVGEVKEGSWSRAHSPTFSSLHLRYSSFSNPSVALPTSQLILQPFSSLNLHHSSFSNPSVALPTWQLISKPSVASPTPELIIQPFRCFTYVTAHSPSLPLLHLRQSSFSNPSVASPTSQPFLQPFFRDSYVTGSSLTSPGEPPMPFFKVFSYSL